MFLQTLILTTEINQKYMCQKLKSSTNERCFNRNKLYKMS
jgi:hypothetical protein